MQNFFDLTDLTSIAYTFREHKIAPPVYFAMFTLQISQLCQWSGNCLLLFRYQRTKESSSSVICSVLFIFSEILNNIKIIISSKI